jgi:hypothetical protein
MLLKLETKSKYSDIVIICYSIAYSAVMALRELHAVLL